MKTLEERRKYDKEHRNRTLLDHRKYFREWYARNAVRQRELYKQRYQRDKEKHRDRHLRKTYGITIEEYDNILLSQGGGCAICGTIHPTYRHFHVDHCHVTGKVRGILCLSCNAAVGHSRENVSILNKMIEYLQKHQ